MKLTENRILIGGLALTTLVYSSSLLDVTLLPRFLMLAFTLLAYLLWTRGKLKKTPFTMSLIQAAAVGFGLLQFASIYWAVNKAEAMLEAERCALGILIFLVMVYSLGTESAFEKTFLKVTLLLSLVYQAKGLYQLSQLTIVNYETVYEIFSFSGHKNLFASLNFLFFIFGIVAIFQLEGIWKRVAGIHLAGSLFFIILLQTRAVWLGFASAMIFFLLTAITHISILKKIKITFRHTLLITGGILLITGMACSLLLPQKSMFDKRLDVGSYATSAAGAERLVLWEKTLQLVQQQPVLGVGAGNWQIAYPRVGLKGLTNVEFNQITFQRPHNDLLWILSETGTVGFMMYALFVCLLFYHGIKSLCNSDSPGGFIQLSVLLSGFAGYLVISFFDFPKERIEHLIFSSALLACIYHRSAPTWRHAFTLRTVRPQLLWWCCVLICACAIVTALFRMNGEYQMGRVYAYKQQQQWRKVIRHAGLASSYFYSIDPVSMPVYWYKGLAEFSSGNFQEALVSFTEARKVAPYNHYVLGNLGSTYELTGNTLEARTQYQEALKIAPQFSDALLNLAALDYNEKKYASALQLANASPDCERKKQYLSFIKYKIAHP